MVHIHTKQATNEGKIDKETERQAGTRVRKHTYTRAHTSPVHKQERKAYETKNGEKNLLKYVYL